MVLRGSSVPVHPAHTVEEVDPTYREGPVRPLAGTLDPLPTQRGVLGLLLQLVTART